MTEAVVQKKVMFEEEVVAKKEIPKVFIAEIMDGVPLYYRGYKEIINQPFKAEQIRGAGGIHSILLYFFDLLLADNLDRKKYWKFIGESGLKIEKHNLYNLDLAIYLKEKMPSRSISKHVSTVPPELVIEIDTSIEMEDLTDDQYVFKKTQQLLNFGTKKVVWVFSTTNRVMIAEPNTPWQVHPWKTTLELLDGITFNIENFCRENDLENLLNL